MLAHGAKRVNEKSPGLVQSADGGFALVAARAGTQKGGGS
jgi:hypothetical protein